MMTRSGVPASTFADLARGVMEVLSEDTASLLAADPTSVIRERFGLTVEIRHAVDGPCGVAGRYYEPRRLIVVDGRSVPARQRFTLLHELGHHLAYDHDNVADLLEETAVDEAEEDFCDAFAAAILLPDELVDQHIGDEGPTARQLVELHRASTASREACAVAAAQRLPGAGYVIIAHTDGTVQFAARSRTPYRVARDTPQPGSVLADAGSTGRARSDRTTLTYRRGGRTDPYAADAVRDDGYVFAVLTRGRPPWEAGLWLPLDETPDAVQAVCGRAQCGHEWLAYGNPCPRCGEHRCPNCGHCGCGHSNTPEGTCVVCGLLKPEHRLDDDGVCTDCA